MPSAIAFSGGMQNAGRMIGPTIAGLLLAYFSEAFCFVLNAVTKFWLIGSLLLIGAAPRTEFTHSANLWASVREGASYTWSLKPLRYLLPILALMSFTITSSRSWACIRWDASPQARWPLLWAHRTRWRYLA